jgi:hypothetical protein
LILFYAFVSLDNQVIVTEASGALHIVSWAESYNELFPMNLANAPNRLANVPPPRRNQI